MRYGGEGFAELLHGFCSQEAEGWASETASHYAHLLAETCESPIERRLGAALLCELDFFSLYSRDDTRFFGSSGRLWHPTHHVWSEALRRSCEDQSATEIIALVPQYRVEGRRADFVLAIQGVPDVDLDNFPHPLYPTEVRMLVVECDGHDFHERTKKQASRDRSWDRALQRAGIGILRFTGSEIVASPFECAEEVGGLINRWVTTERRRFVPAIGEERS